MQRALPAKVALGVLAMAAAIGAGILLEALSSHAFSADSDGATIVLEGQAMAHGYPMLQHWGLSLDSFWTVDALWYLVGVVVTGVSPVLMHAVPAAMAAAVVVLGVVLAAEGHKGAATLAGAATVVAVLALPSHALAIFLLQGPLHVGTVLWCLVAFYFVRAGRFDWRWGIAVVFLVAGLLGDFQTIALGVAPVGLAGVTAAARTRDWRRAVPLVAAAVASFALYELLRHVARALGGFTIASTNPHASLNQMLHNVKHGFHEALVMLGTGSAYFGLGGEPTALGYTRVVITAVVVFALVAAAFAVVWGVIAGRQTVVAGAGRSYTEPPAHARGRSRVEPFVVDDLCLFGAIASGAAFCFLAFTATPQFARYLTAAIIFATILAGRMMTRAVSTLSSRALLGAGAVIGLALLACYGAGEAYVLSQPEPPEPAAALSTWLEAHHLDHGIGAYWSASIVTVYSHGKVEVRPVVSPSGGRLYRYDRNSASYWYDEPFDFLVYEPGAPWGGVNVETATATYGRPAAAHSVDGYLVLVWNKVLHVAPQSAASQR